MKKNKTIKKSSDEEEDDEDKTSDCGAYGDNLSDLMTDQDSDLDIDSDDSFELPQPVSSASETVVPMHKYPFKLKQCESG